MIRESVKSQCGSYVAFYILKPSQIRNDLNTVRFLLDHAKDIIPGGSTEELFLNLSAYSYGDE